MVILVTCRAGPLRNWLLVGAGGTAQAGVVRIRNKAWRRDNHTFRAMVGGCNAKELIDMLGSAEKVACRIHLLGASGTAAAAVDWILVCSDIETSSFACQLGAGQQWCLFCVSARVSRILKCRQPGV